MGMINELLEAHFCCMSSQSNIYGMAKLPIIDGMGKILVASLKRKVYIFEYASSSMNNNLIPSSHEIQFTYIPSAAEIISIDAFNKSTYSNDFVVGITFIKNVENSKHYLNIYSSDCEHGSAFNIDTLAQTCSSLELDFTPYQLLHTEIFNGKSKEMVLLLCGGDSKVHVYREDKSLNCYKEYNSSEYFPECDDLPSIILRMKIINFDEHKRLTVFGCENGYVRAALVNMKNKEVIMSSSVQHDSPVSVIEVFTESNQCDWPAFLQPIGGESQEDSSDGSIADCREYHILIGCSIEPAVVYMNFLDNQFGTQQVLPNSDNYDCVLAGCVADVDMDGNNELILGTYGQELMAYKLNSQTKKFEMTWQKSLAYPVLALDYDDITDDGLKELLVLSVKGLHILQHDLDAVAELCRKRLNKLTVCLRKDDTFKELQSEDL